MKIGCKVILIHNIDTSDGLTNGQLGILKAVIRANDGSISKCIIEFKRENAGSKSRANNKQYAERYPRGTVIEKVSFSYPLSRKATSASAKATLIQYPIKVAHAITAHKIQGQTIPKPMNVALDIKSVFEDGQAHVMFSRVEELDQVYVLESLPEEKIRASAKALAELHEMNRRSINANPIPWKQKNKTDIKIASLNCMNLLNTHEDIVGDKTLLESSILILSETWLKGNTKLQIEGYKTHINSVGPGKGIAVYIKDNEFVPQIDIKMEKMQLTKIESKDIDIIAVYRSEQGNTSDLLRHITDMIKEEKATIILGDFNICYQTIKNNKISKYLVNNGFKQFVDEPTHIKGGHIDHLYFKPSKTFCASPSMYRYTPYYSDHDAICVTFKRP